MQNRNPGLLIMCKICCDKIRKNRKLTKKNLENMKLINDYISKLKQNCTESTYTLLSIEVIDIYPKSIHDWKMGNNDARQIEIKIYQDCNNTSLTDSNDDEKNYLDLSKEKIKQILNDLNINAECDEYQNNSSLSSIENRVVSVGSSLDVLYSSYSDKSANNISLDTTTDGEYLENIQKLNETNFDNTDIETIIHSGYSYEIDLTTSHVNTSVNKAFTENTNDCDDEKMQKISHSSLVINDNVQLMNDTTDEIYCKQQPSKTENNLVTFENGTEEKKLNGIINGNSEINSAATEETDKTMIIDVKPFECETCKKRFESEVYLKLHKTKVHSNTANKISKEDLKCSVCEKVFKIHSQLVKHVLTHSNDRPFQCIICKKGFKTERNRKAHMLYHTELKFACSICNKKFVTNGILKDHLLTHSDPKFKCSICNRAFTVENYLKKHLKTHNENEKKFQCETCSKRFLYRSNYVAHNLTCIVPSVSFTNV